MVSQTEIYNYLKENNNKTFTTREMHTFFRDRHIGRKLRQLHKFKMISGDFLDESRKTIWWGAQ